MIGTPPNYLKKSSFTNSSLLCGASFCVDEVGYRARGRRVPHHRVSFDTVSAAPVLRLPSNENLLQVDRVYLGGWAAIIILLAENHYVVWSIGTSIHDAKATVEYDEE